MTNRRTSDRQQTMPSRPWKVTLYVKDSDRPIWERARELLGEESLSAFVTEAISLLVARREAEAKGMRSIELHLGTGTTDFPTVTFWGRELVHIRPAGPRSEGVHWWGYETARGQLVIVRQEIRSAPEPQATWRHWKFPTLLDLLNAVEQYPTQLVVEVMRALGKERLELDI